MPMIIDPTKLLVIPFGEVAPRATEEELRMFSQPADRANTYITFDDGPCKGEYARVELLTNYVWQKVPRKQKWARYARDPFSGLWVWDGQTASSGGMHGKIAGRTDVRQSNL